MLGIIGAMKAEVEQLKQEMKQPEVVTVAGMEFYKGTIGEKEVAVVLVWNWQGQRGTVRADPGRPFRRGWCG